MKSGMNAIVGQSGGPTAAINATLAGVIRGCHGKFSHLYGMKSGMEGLLCEELVCLDYLFGNERELDLLSRTPSSVLGSCRQRLPSQFDSPVYERLFKILEKHSIDCFFYIGGNDSMDTVDKLSRYAKAKGVDVSFIGVPKTIDNDLVLTDHTPGYGSCAKYIATTVAELYRDVSVYRIPCVTIVEVMGRDAGWLGCACALPSFKGGGCGLVYLPESGFSLDTMLSDAEDFLSKSNTLLLGISEGACPTRHGLEDSFGHRRVSGGGKVLEDAIAKHLGCKARAVELNITQRCASHLLSLTDIKESLLIGEKAVQLALDGHNGVMATFERSVGEYGVRVSYADASQVANRVKSVPREFIDTKNRFITDKCVEYISPLILGEISSEYNEGIPHYFNLG